MDSPSKSEQRGLAGEDEVSYQVERKMVKFYIAS